MQVFHLLLRIRRTLLKLQDLWTLLAKNTRHAPPSSRRSRRPAASAPPPPSNRPSEQAAAGPEAAESTGRQAAAERLLQLRVWNQLALHVVQSMQGFMQAQLYGAPLQRFELKVRPHVW